MIEAYFVNLENITKTYLLNAKKSIKAAIAWINFNIYGSIFEELIKQGVKIEIILHDDFINQRYIDYIDVLNQKGADIRLVRFAGTMHHKFCVIDDRICLFGSFNWTKSAIVKNMEDLNICDEIILVYAYLSEFYALSNLSKSDIKLLKTPTKCSCCKQPIINILFAEQDGYYHTKISIIQRCDCNEEQVFLDYYDLSVYNNFISIGDKFEEELSEAHENNDIETYNQILMQQDYELKNSLSFVRNIRFGLPIIHAVAVKAWRAFHNDGEWFYKIIWKERGTESYILDEYDCF